MIELSECKFPFWARYINISIVSPFVLFAAFINSVFFSTCTFPLSTSSERRCARDSSIQLYIYRRPEISKWRWLPYRYAKIHLLLLLLSDSGTFYTLLVWQFLIHKLFILPLLFPLSHSLTRGAVWISTLAPTLNRAFPSVHFVCSSLSSSR